MRIIIRLFILILLCSSSFSYAGFVVKRPAGVLSLEAPATDTVKRVKSRAEVFAPGYREQRRTERHRRHEEEMKDQHGNSCSQKGGGLGIAAFVCACVFYWPLAIIFGAIAMKKSRKNWKLARAGFIIGLAEAAFYILMIVGLSMMF